MLVCEVGKEPVHVEGVGVGKETRKALCSGLSSTDPGLEDLTLVNHSVVELCLKIQVVLAGFGVGPSARSTLVALHFSVFSRLSRRVEFHVDAICPQAQMQHGKCLSTRIAKWCPIIGTERSDEPPAEHQIAHCVEYLYHRYLADPFIGEKRRRLAPLRCIRP